MHTVSLEVARQMKEAGWKQEGADWYWMRRPSWWQRHWRIKPNTVDIIAAPELGEIVREMPIGFSVYRMREGWETVVTTDPKSRRIYNDTPEDAAGLAWIEQQGGTE